MSGKLYCVSVGPGDPELMTVKSVKLIKSCPVIASPVTTGEKTMALNIVRQGVDISDKEIILLDFPMSSDKDVLAAAHEKNAASLVKCLSEGKDVAFINIGDVSVFSTVSWVVNAVSKAGFETQLIPGVTSFCACACALGKSLTAMKSPLHIFPGSFADTEKALSMSGTKVFMKSGKSIGGVRDVILNSGAAASAVSNCGLDSQRLYPELAQLPDDAGYFTTIIVEENKK